MWNSFYGDLVHRTNRLLVVLSHSILAGVSIFIGCACQTAGS